MGRTFLGQDYTLAGYRRVFEIEDGLEIDENNYIMIERTRVYFDDVLAITLHREIGAVFLVGVGLCLALFGFLAVLFAVNDEMVPAIVFACVAAPFAVGVVLRLLVRVHVITVFGRRTMARMKFGFRAGRARDVYVGLMEKIRARQQRAAAAQPAAPPPPEIPLPPPPPAAP